MFKHHKNHEQILDTIAHPLFSVSKPANISGSTSEDQAPTSPKVDETKPPTKSLNSVLASLGRASPTMPLAHLELSWWQIEDIMPVGSCHQLDTCKVCWRLSGSTLTSTSPWIAVSSLCFWYWNMMKYVCYVYYCILFTSRTSEMGS